MSKSDMDALRQRSGNVRLHNRLVSFLYDLMRDHLPPGVIEKLVQEATEPDVTYTNGWLALYAQDLAQRLQNPIPDPGDHEWTKATPVPMPGLLGQALDLARDVCVKCGAKRALVQGLAFYEPKGTPEEGLGERPPPCK